MRSNTHQNNNNNLCLETYNPEIFSTFRRLINSSRENQLLVRKNALNEFLEIIRKQPLTAVLYDEVMSMCLKNMLGCFSDKGEVCRQTAVTIIIQLLTRCTSIQSSLPYILSVLVDRTNCIDLDGIDSLPEKMRPAPGQKPKIMIKIVQNCEQIRLLYCELLSKIFSLTQVDQIRKHLDDIVNILRTLVMDPSPQIQVYSNLIKKNACSIMQHFCQDYQNILLHYTEALGRSVLLPLVSKKSKIRIAALNTLTAIFGCGLWKYNAFVFENLIGFRDPNSVPIKDFYQVNNNLIVAKSQHQLFSNICN